MTVPTATPSEPLGVGDRAPAFALRNQYGETVSLDDFRGEKHVVLVFFPFAFSGVCTGEFGEIRERLEDFEGDDVQVLGISCDPMESLRAWADQEAYFFPAAQRLLAARPDRAGLRRLLGADRLRHPRDVPRRPGRR